MGMHRMPLLGALALTISMAGSSPKEKVGRTYRTPLGPPFPNTRQQRRAMERASKKALAAIQGEQSNG